MPTPAQSIISWRSALLLVCLLGGSLIALAQITERERENTARLHIGPQAQNGSFETGDLAGWRELSGGLGRVRMLQDNLITTAAEGQAFFHFRLDLADGAQRTQASRISLERSVGRRRDLPDARTEALLAATRPA